AAATATDGPMAAVARTLGRLPYRTADQIAKTDSFLRQILTLSSQLDRKAATAARTSACDGIEILARLHAKLFPVPDETLALLRGIATAASATVSRGALPLRVAALRALASAGAVDADTLRQEISDAACPSLRRLSIVALGGAGSPVLGADRF